VDEFPEMDCRGPQSIGAQALQHCFATTSATRNQAYCVIFMNAMDRKKLIRQYKETRRPMGVYRVHNTRNGKSLVGASADLRAALNRHRAQLRLEVHSNRALQRDWQEMGPEAFEFEVLDTLAPPEQRDYNPSEDLRVLEELWLDRLTPFDDRGYNARPRLAA
jgi:hypothetical protein